MRSAITRACILIVAFTVANHSNASSGPGTAYKVIVHPDNPATVVSESFLRNAYLKKANSWGNGDTVRPVDLKGGIARERFTHDVIKKTPEQLRNYWNQQIFSGKGVPPDVLDSPGDVIKYVLANPGAVGYLPVDAAPGGAKVVATQP